MIPTFIQLNSPGPWEQQVAQTSKVSFTSVSRFVMAQHVRQTCCNQGGRWWLQAMLSMGVQL